MCRIYVIHPKMKITTVYMRNLKPPSQKQDDPILIGLKQDNRREKGNQIAEEEKESLME